MSYPKTKDLEGFFFCSLGSRYSNGQRINRSGKGGFWKPTGKDIPISNKSCKVGWRRTRTFYRGKAPGTITDWRIHEYGLEDKNEFVVLCKIFEKKSRGPKTDEEYESPVEDDADDCVNGEDGSLLSNLPPIPSSSLGPKEGQNAVATISTLDLDRQDAVLQPLPTHSATPIVPRHHLSSPGHEIHKSLLNVSDEDRNTCNGSGCHQVDSVPSKSTVEDLDTHENYKGLEVISDDREKNPICNSNSWKHLEEENLWQDHWSPGFIDGFMELKDFFLNNVSDEDGNTCNGSGSQQVDSVPTKSTVEDLDTHGIYKGSEDISDHREMDSIDNSNLIKQLEEENFLQHHLSPGSIDGLEVNDLSIPMEEDWEACIQWDDLSSPVAADDSNQGTSFLPAPNATQVLPAHEGHREPTCDCCLFTSEIVGHYTPQSLARGIFCCPQCHYDVTDWHVHEYGLEGKTVGTPKRARIKGKSSKIPSKKPLLSINTPLMIEDSPIKASTSHTLDKEQTYEVDASNFDAAFGDVNDIPFEDLISVLFGPQGYNTPPKVTCQTIIVAPSPATIDSLIWRCKHIPRLRKIPDRFLNYQHPLPPTGYFLTEVEKELLMGFYKYFTHRKKELDMIISCVDSKSLKDLLDDDTWMDSSIIYFWFDVLRERCKDAYLADPSICSLWENGQKIGDDMAFGPKGERVMEAMECKTLVYVLHAHNHWSLLVGYVDENCWEYYNSLKGEIWGQNTCERFRLWLQQRFMDHGWSVPKMWTITTKTDIPFQDNGNDCGLFACAFAEHCIYRCPIKFTQLDIPYYRRRIVIDIFKQNWIRNASKLNLPPLPVLLPDLQ